MFCLEDGVELLYGLAKSEPPASAGGQFDREPQTAILHSTAAPGEAPTHKSATIECYKTAEGFRSISTRNDVRLALAA